MDYDTHVESVKRTPCVDAELPDSPTQHQWHRSGRRGADHVGERRLELCRDEDERKEGGPRSTGPTNNLRSSKFSANVISVLLSPVYMHYSQFAKGAKLLQGCVRGRDRIIEPRSLFGKGPLPLPHSKGMGSRGAAKQRLEAKVLLKQK